MDSGNRKEKDGGFAGSRIACHDTTEPRAGIRTERQKAGETESHTRIMLNAAPLACSLWDDQEHVLDCNKEALRIFGLNSLEEYRKHIVNLSPEFQSDGTPSREGLNEKVRAAIKTGYQQFEWMHRTMEGEPLPVETTIVRIPLEKGCQVVIYARDLRDIKAHETVMRKADKRMRLMLDVIPMACIFLDDTGNAIDCNAYTPKFFGFKNKEEFLSRPFDWIPEYQPDGKYSQTEKRRLVQEVLKTGSSQFEWIHRTVTGEELPTAVWLVRVEWNNKFCTAAYARDLRSQKDAEKKALEAGRHSREMEAQTLAARAASEAKSSVLAAMSHEIRTPLNAIIGLSEIELQKDTAEDTRANLEKIYRSGSALLGIINDVMNISRIDEGNLEPDRDRNLIRSYMPYGRVLVVDDIETNLDVARGLLLPYGLAIDCASGGSEAIEKIRAVEAKPGTEKYDLIFMDYMMPGMDGIEAVRIIRNEIGSVYARTVPIIALTANAIKGNEELFLSRGFNAYITKPIDIFRLDAALNVWIRNKQTRETLDRAESEKAAGKEEHGAAPPDLFGGLSVPGIDLAEGKKRYSNDAAFLEIIRSYCVHTPSLLEKIRVFSEEAPDQYTIAVHGLKGSSYGICADEAGNYAAAMEAAARAGDIETIKAKNSGLITTVETLISGLNEVLAKTGKNRDKKQRAAPDPALLDRLLEACKQYRLALMEEAVTELEKYEYDSGGNLVVWLREQLDSLEYDAMQDFLENRNSLSQTVKTQLLQEGNYGSQKSYTGG